MQIAGLEKSSLVDYPSKIAAVVFLQGCNFRCSFCHNGNLLPLHAPKEFISRQDFFTFLQSRQKKLDGVVISGGEPTLHKELEEFIKQIRDMGFLIKLDTNGTNPKMLKSLAAKGYLDYVAMDIKAPLEKYEKITLTKVNIENIKESIDFLICQSRNTEEKAAENADTKIDCEFRTTVVKEDLLPHDFIQIAKEINGAKNYYLQKFIPEHAQDETFKNKSTYSDEEFISITETIRPYIANVYIR